MNKGCALKFTMSIKELSDPEIACVLSAFFLTVSTAQNHFLLDVCLKIQVLGVLFHKYSGDDP